MSNSAQTSIQNSQHSDLITSLSFDLFGTRLATSSLDHTIRVTSLSSTTGLWDSNLSDFKAHDSPVLKVVWGHPEFGTLLASGGVDGIVKIWTEEDSIIRNNNNNSNNNNNNSSSSTSNTTSKRWVQRAALTDCRGTIRDIEFSPPEFGLKLACISSDSHLRLWECLDPISFSDWSLIEDIDLGSLPLGISTGQSGVIITSGGGGGNVTRNSSSIALASGINSASIKGFEVGGSPARGSTTTGGSSTSGIGGVPSTSLGSASTTTSGSGSNGQIDSGRKSGTVESDGGWSLSWCKEAWWGERLAVSAGPSGIIRLFHLPDHAPWTNFANLLPPRPSSSFSQPAPVSSLAWAPASGRSYQLLASGSRDGRARIWKLFPPSLSTPVGITTTTGGGGGGEEKWTTEMDAELEEGGSRNGGGSVGNVKVDWNLTGTVVSTAGEDAKVRLWKSNYVGEWKSIALLSTEESDEGMSVDK